MHTRTKPSVLWYLSGRWRRHLIRGTVTAHLFFKIGKELELQRDMLG